MKPVARLGDPSDHGGTLISASPNVFANNIPVVRHSDEHSCPIKGHGVTPMNSDCNVFANSLPLVRVGLDLSDCGATPSEGSPNVFIQG